jgi:2-polyprenyl-3-methyl-5-hydroxy-6-metoxy-1,4-benzoquinol methylase
MNKNQIKKYLNFLKIKEFYPMKYKKCEICGSFKTKLIKKKISWNNNKFGVLPIHCCSSCGFLFQNPRFSKKFYMEYYKNSYRAITLKTLIPPKKLLKDQKIRGKKLYDFLKPFIPKKGSMLDVGSSVGLMMLPFLNKGWKCEGNDPIKSFVDYGNKVLKLPVKWLQSEDMVLKKNSLDLIIIMGSLEHVVDVNLVMKKCAKAMKKNGILVLEARGDPLGFSKDFFNQNHHRYFFGNTMELIMIKYGWKPFLTTKYPLTGPSRPNSQFCIGKFIGSQQTKKFKNLISNGKRETYLDIIYKLKYHDLIAKK